MKNERDSNIELLRLLCMFMIVFGHFLYHGIFNCSSQYILQEGWNSYAPQLLYGFVICAVDTFILISGYYGIRPKAKSFFNLYLQCAFYAGILYLIHLYLTGSHLNRWCFYNTLLPFSNNPGWWFIPQYVILYILSPILNKVVDNSNKRQFGYYLILMSVVAFYFGCYRQFKFSFAENGFNFINFIFLYFVGRYIALYYVPSLSSKKQRFLFGGGYLMSGILIGFLEWSHLRIISSWNPIFLVGSYNHPLCVLEAVCLFMFMKSCPFKSRMINWFGASTLAIYLIHDCVYFREYLYQYVAKLYDKYPPSSNRQFGALICMAIGIVLICPLIDKIRIVITKPLNTLLCRVWYKAKNILCQKLL